MKTLSVVGAAIIDPPYVLAFRRAPHTSLAGKWEFPGGKIEPNESPQAALARELNEELQLQVPIGPQLGIGSAKVKSDVYVELLVFEVEVSRDEIHYVLSDHDLARWTHVNELNNLHWAPADIPVLKTLKMRLTP